MKHFLSIILFTIASLAYSQSEHIFTRKGKIIVETGTVIQSPTSHTVGVNFEGDFGSYSNVNFGFNLGYFVSEDLAVKLIFNSNDLFNRNVPLRVYNTEVMLGAKYYLFDRFPVQIIGGRRFSSFSNNIITSGGSTTDFGLYEDSNTAWVGGINVGYALKLADNIYLEPYFGRIIVNYSSIVLSTFTGGFSFAMFLGKNK